MENLHEFNILYLAPTIIRLVKSGRIRVGGHVWETLTITNLIHTYFILQYVQFKPLNVPRIICSSSEG